MIRKSTATCALTVDVEDYFHVSAFESVVEPHQWKNIKSRVEDNTYRVMELFDAHAAKATFFILGWVAERHPQLIRQISDCGHEIACHGYAHRRIYTQTKDQFFADIVKSKQIIEDISGVQVQGYRAPSFSITTQSEWAYALLKQAGFTYSSSTVPTNHDLYGVPDWPAFPYMRPEGIYEIPMPTISIAGKRMSIAGGGYFRLLPETFSRWAINNYIANTSTPYCFYFHPWEIDLDQPRFTHAPLKSRIRHYTNLNKMLPRIDRLLQCYEWGAMRDIYKDGISNV